jgi:hypothetical protein
VQGGRGVGGAGAGGGAGRGGPVRRGPVRGRAIAGSHKANFPCPRGISRWEQDQSAVINPGARAGDVIIFTEALAHGTLP